MVFHILDNLFTPVLRLCVYITLWSFNQTNRQSSHALLPRLNRMHNSQNCSWSPFAPAPSLLYPPSRFARLYRFVRIYLNKNGHHLWPF